MIRKLEEYREMLGARNYQVVESVVRYHARKGTDIGLANALEFVEMGYQEAVKDMKRNPDQAERFKQRRLELELACWAELARTNPNVILISGTKKEILEQAGEIIRSARFPEPGDPGYVEMGE
ncbi:MAG: hypothetical protein WC796_06100 [Candidatus Pacearchaeota archaeon]